MALALVGPVLLFAYTQAGDLPAGLYFLQVLEDGNMLAVGKFVKQ